MQKKFTASRLRKQAGFTMVELSVVLVVGGLLLAAAVKGQEMVDTAKSIKFLNDLKNTEMLVQKYATMKSRMPGDCNGDGIIDAAVDAVTRADSGNATRAGLYDFTTTRATYAATSGTVASATEGCAQINGTALTASTTNDVSVWLNDLKLAGLVSDVVPNRVFAKTVNEDFMFVGKVTDTSPTSTSTNADYNAIVVHNVPQWMARYVATAINGTDAVSNRNRVRSLDLSTANGTYETTWDVAKAKASGTAETADASRNTMVSIAYFFDRIPATE